MDTEQKLRIGFIGSGEIAVATAEAIQRTPNATTTIVMDTNPAIAQDLGERVQAPATTDTEEVLNHPQVDAVYIATPHHLHAPLVIQAAEAGKHVLVEKPLSTTIADGEEMIAACQRAGVRLSVCYVMRYLPAVIEARRLFRSGAIGKAIGFSVRVIGRKQSSYWTGGYSGRAQTDWRQFWRTSGGGILNINLTHNLDILRYITGLEAVRVYGEWDTFVTPVEVEDEGAILLRMDNGAIGTVHAASCVPIGSEGPGNGSHCDRIYGTEGTLSYFMWSAERLWLANPDSATNRTEWREIELAKGSPEARTGYIQDFADAVLTSKPTPLTGEDGLAMVKIVQSAYESGRTHLPITLET